MSLDCYKNGSHITMKCDLCGRRTKSLKRITGHWLNPRNGRKVLSGGAWACPDCVAKMRSGDGRP